MAARALASFWRASLKMVPSRVAAARANVPDDVANGSVVDPAVADAAIPMGQIDPVYEAKAMVINRAIQDLDIGRYHYQLLLVAGFGWVTDNVWPVLTSLILAPVTNEFRPEHPALLILCQNIGLLVGALFWGFTCDIIGRKPAFNCTLVLTATFALIAPLAHNFATITAMAGMWSIGVGGNLPVDSALLLEFLPASAQHYLTGMSVVWAASQLIVTAIAYPVLDKLSCPQGQMEPCTTENNLGWRCLLAGYGLVTLFLFATRLHCFPIYESPKFLVGIGKDEEAVEVIQKVALLNRMYSTLSIRDLKACEPVGYVRPFEKGLVTGIVDRVRALFTTKKMARSTGLVMVIWALVGWAYPLYNAFMPYIMGLKALEYEDGSMEGIYKRAVLVAFLGMSGAMAAASLIKRRWIGRRGTFALSAAVTGALLYGSTTEKSSADIMNWIYGVGFASNAMLAVLYGFTPELFATPQRGTGNALAAACGRACGILAPIMAIFGNLETVVPVYASGGLFIAAGLLALGMPFESQGRAAL